jgi:hypothetical protein
MERQVERQDAKKPSSEEEKAIKLSPLFFLPWLLGVQYSSGGVVSAPAERMTSRHAFHRPPCTTGSSVFINRIDGVLTARRNEPAVPAEQSAQRDAIQQHELDEQPFHVNLRAWRAL